MSSLEEEAAIHDLDWPTDVKAYEKLDEIGEHPSH